MSSLGQGGGGQVYRAWDPRLEREVALKILPERPDTGHDRLRRFVAEARAASALNHPNIVTVHDEMRRGPVPLKRLLDLATQIADGLTAAHHADIVHRDLKPENIMVTRAGRAKILDFGLAWSGGFEPAEAGVPVQDTRTETALGLRAGTVPYMSPEQARGAPSDVRSDQFSFGLILYEMPTGRSAFRRETPAATLDAIINDDLPPMAALDARTPLMLRWIIERCLAKEPDDRYGSTADLHRDLRMLRGRLPEAVARESAAARPLLVPVWRRVLAGGVFLGALTAAAILGAALFAPQPDTQPTVRFAPLTTAPEYEGFPAWSPDGKSIAYAAEVDGFSRSFNATWSRPPRRP